MGLCLPIFWQFHLDNLSIWTYFMKLLLYQVSMLPLKLPLILASPFVFYPPLTYPSRLSLPISSPFPLYKPILAIYSIPPFLEYPFDPWKVPYSILNLCGSTDCSLVITDITTDMYIWANRYHIVFLHLDYLLKIMFSDSIHLPANSFLSLFYSNI